MSKIFKEVEPKLLAQDVLAVAVEGNVGDWAAYIGARNTEELLSNEVVRIRQHGVKLPYKVAAAIFPDWVKKFKWRE